jgi:hypothetical protein
VRWYFWIFGWGCGHKGRWASRGSEGEGGGSLGSSHSGRALGRSSTSAWHHDTPSPPLPRRLTNVHRISMRCGCIRDETLREEASARRGSYWGSFGGQLLTDMREVRACHSDVPIYLGLVADTLARIRPILEIVFFYPLITPLCSRVTRVGCVCRCTCPSFAL